MLGRLLTQRLDWLRAQPGMDEPLVRWGMVLCAGIVFWAFIITPYLDWRDVQQSHIETGTNKALKLEALKLSSKEWKEAVDLHKKTMQTVSEAMFQDSSYAGAQALLLKTVTALVRSHHLTIDSQRLLDEIVEEKLVQKVGVMLRMHGKQLDIMNFIHAAAQTPKLITLENLYMNQPGVDKDMMLQFQAYGFRLGAGK